MISDNAPSAAMFATHGDFPLDDPLTSHCALCAGLAYLGRLEAFVPAERVVQLRHRAGQGCRAGEPRPELNAEPVATVSGPPVPPGAVERILKRIGLIA